MAMLVRAKRRLKLLSVIGLLLMLPACAATSPVHDTMPAHEFAQIQHREIELTRLNDPGASVLRVRLTFPVATGPHPFVVFSHGNFLSRVDYDPLVEAWARAGFIVAQPDHPDAASGEARPVVPSDTWRTRISDLHHVLDSLGSIDAALRHAKVRIDRDQLFVAGHSFGAHSAAALVGMTVRDPQEGGVGRFADARVRGALLLSPPGHARDLVPEWQPRAPYLDTDWHAMRGPVLIVSGDEDTSPMARDAGPAWHHAPFSGSQAKGICLVAVPGADHYLFGISRPLGKALPPDPRRRDDLIAMTTAYLSALTQAPRPAMQDAVTRQLARDAGLTATCH